MESKNADDVARPWQRLQSDGAEAGDRGGSGSAMRYSTTTTPERRVQAIDWALRGRKWPTVQGLAVDLGVGPRTIGRDIRLMRLERNAPIAYDRRRGGYFCEEPAY